MYKVVLIDDEETILEGLKKVVDWAKYDCEVVAVAIDAKEGAMAIRQHRPDILFTDIRMPDMDGLTMLAGLKGEFPHMKITVLTGFRDFEYAQHAITLGVSRFLLKPSRMSEIEEALKTMTACLKEYEDIPLPEDDEESEQNSVANSFILRSAMKYIEQHYAEKLTLTELADQIHVSKWYLSKLLNKYMDKSFNDIINEARVKKAEKLLEDPSLRIHQISDILGFNDVTHFSKTFKKFREVSPNEFRNNIGR